MNAHLRPLAALSVLLAAPLSADVPVCDFDDISVWSPHRDGGHAPEFSLDTDHARVGAAMRIRYADQPPHWGNLTAPCEVPADARALRFWVYKHSATTKAAMHIWLFEPDDDGWLQRVPFEGKSLSQAETGWHEVRMPIAGFRFQPRGKKTRQMTSTNRMLIGCNFGDFEVTIDNMTWEIGPGGKAVPLPKTDGLQIEIGQRGSIGILDMGEGLPGDFETAHPPEQLAKAVRHGGFGATILKPGDLADNTILTRENFAAVILPFGPYFPQEARETFLGYLRSGGSFLSTDGYAFDALLALTDAGWSPIGPDRTAAETDEPEPPAVRYSMNTRVAKPGDQMSLKPEQIGVFDPQFPLEHATSFRLADPGWLSANSPRDAATEALPTYDFEAPVSGFSACGLTGLNGAVFPPVYRRWIPVLNAFSCGPDNLAGHRGPDNLVWHALGTALAIMHNYAGEFKGASWAFSGLTSATDIFLADPARRHLLIRVLRDITERAFLHELATDLACYEAGETAKITVRVSNHGDARAIRTISIKVGDGAILQRDLLLKPGETQTVEATVPVDELIQDYDYVPLVAMLSEGDRIADRMESAFCIRNEAVLASGPKIGWADNYMTVDGRPTFLIGTNQTGMMYFSANENPAIWDRDFRSMAQHNFHIMRILHFSPFSKGGYEGKPTNKPLDLAQRPKKLVRQMDAIMQLAQKHRVAIFLSLHDWMGTVLTDEELQAQADWNRFWSERYKDVPGIFYDVQNEPSVRALDRPDVLALWNRFLQERYETDEALRAAWTKSPPEAPLPNVPLGPTTDDWDDARAADRKRFETELLNRWVKANVEGIRAGDPDALVCVGYLPSMPPADKILGVKHTDFSNMHYYGSPDSFPLEFKLIDRRFLGKGLSLGECGARQAHDARTHGRFGVPVAESIQRFQTYIHYAPALGAAFICNWDWKDFDEMVFPWGLMRHCSNIPKPWLHTWEQGSLLLSLAEPVYEPPELFILAPDSNRIGPRFNDLHNALKRSIDLLLDQRINFGMVNEEDLSQLLALAVLPSPEGRGVGGEASVAVRRSPPLPLWQGGGGRERGPGGEAAVAVRRSPPLPLWQGGGGRERGPGGEAAVAVRRSPPLPLWEGGGGRERGQGGEAAVAVPPALLWPLPYCPSDETFDRVLSWVKAGGTLYLSGDISFDRARRPTRTERRAALGLPEAEPVPPFETPDEAWTQPPIETSVGKGKVLFVPYPLELRHQPTDASIYQRFIALAGLNPIALEFEEEHRPFRALSIPTRDGGRLTMIARRSSREGLAPVTLRRPDNPVGHAVRRPDNPVGQQGQVTVELEPSGFAFILQGANGEIIAAESQGRILLGKEPVYVGDAQGHYGLCGLDGKDLRETRQLLVLPHQCESVDVSGLSHLRDAHCCIGPPGRPDNPVWHGSPHTLVAPIHFPPGALGQVAIIAPENEMPAALQRLQARLEVRF